MTIALENGIFECVFTLTPNVCCVNNLYVIYHCITTRKLEENKDTPEIG